MFTRERVEGRVACGAARDLCRRRFALTLSWGGDVTAFVCLDMPLKLARS